MSEIVAFANEIPKARDISAEGLRADTLDITPVNFSWDVDTSDLNRSDGWTWREAITCEHCGAVYVTNSPVECDNTDCKNFGQELDHMPEGPMMNYYYPLPFDPSDTAIAELANLPLCVVYVDEDPALALTGGGMDLSWEICEAFMRLGCLPPLHFAGLPAMAGRGENADDLRIILICEQAVERARELYANRCDRAAREIQTTAEFAKRYAKERGER
jgi:hypothetical protein